MSVSLRFVGVFAVLVLFGGIWSAASVARPGDRVESFGTGGLSVTEPDPAGREAPADMARLPDGSLLVAGSSASGEGSLLIKLRPDGNIDTNFGDQGQLRGSGPGWEQVESLADGRILLAGAAGTDLTFKRLLADGSPDLGFAGTGTTQVSTAAFAPSEGLPADASIASLDLLADGGLRVIGRIGGCSRSDDYCLEPFVAGLDADGSPEVALGPAGAKKLEVPGAGILAKTFPDGTALLVRGENSLEMEYGGRLITTPIDTSGEPGANTYVKTGPGYNSTLSQGLGAITLDESGRVLVADADSVWRVSPLGIPDAGFGDEGRVSIKDLTKFTPGDPSLYVTGIATDSAGRILLSAGIGRDRGARWPGDAWASSGVAARLTAEGDIDSSFGGGGLAIAWEGTMAAEGLRGTTRITVDGDSVQLAGMGPVEGGYGFTAARLENGEMELPLCAGREADYVGTEGPDRVEATEAVIVTLGGRDVVTGGYRSLICSGPGKDFVSLEMGPAAVHGGPGDDIINLGESSVNKAFGGAGDDQVTGGRSRDRLFGGPGNDLLRGRAGDDRLFGGRGDDRLFGHLGRDQLHGGPGRDRLRAGPIGPDPTRYRFKREGKLIMISTLGRRASAHLQLPYSCVDRGPSRGWVTSRKLPFDPRTGQLRRISNRSSLNDDFTLIVDFDAKAEGKRIAGKLRIIDSDHFSDNYTCRTGKGPVRIKSILRDAWIPFGAKALRKPRQFAKQ